MLKLIPTTFALITLVSSSALAAPMCTTGTLASYIDLGSTGCDIGSGTFSGFNTLMPITGALPVAPGDVTITPVLSGDMAGIDVMITATAETGELRQALLGYMLMASSITGSMVTVSGTSTSGGGFVTDIQNYCAGGSFLPGDVTGCTGTDGALVVLNSGSDQATFSAVSQLAIVHDFTLDAGSGGMASGGLVSDRFAVASVGPGPDPDPIPEPQTYVLMSSALVVIGLGSRLKKRMIRATGGQK